MRSFHFVYLTVFLLAVRETAAQGEDATVKDKATGAAVVSTTLRKVKQSCIFPNDFYFMRRVAWVESHFGSDAGTFGRVEPRGIWQLSQRAFEATQNTSAYPKLIAMYQQINMQFGLRWPSVTYAEQFMNKPLHNALAARLYLSTKPSPIPTAVEEQAKYWKREYTIRPGASENTFMKELTGMKQCKSAGVDLVLILDGSGSITWYGFEQIKQVVEQIVDAMEIGGNRTNVAIFVFSTSVSQYVSFSNTQLQNKWDLLRIIRSLRWPEGWTNTHLALQRARNEFLLARNMSLGFPRQIILLTDGLSTNQFETKREAAILRTLPWLEVYSIGMGPDFTSASGPGLAEITDIASYPKCTHVITTPTVDQISALTDDLHDANCLASAPICNSANCSGTISGSVSPGDVRYFRDEAERSVGRSYRLTTTRWTLRLYVSAKFENPGDGLYEFRAEARPGSPAQLFVSPQFLQSVGFSSYSQMFAGNGTTVKLYSAVETETSSDNTTTGAPFALDSAPGEKYKPNSGRGMELSISPIILMATLYMAISKLIQ